MVLLTQGLRAKFRDVLGTDDFFNSGVLINAPPVSNNIGFRSLRKELGDMLIPGDEEDWALWLGPNSLNLPPHYHRGGEIAVVLGGGYSDVDMNGKALATYHKGDIVVYGAFSTHRPSTVTGAQIFYHSLNGTTFPTKPGEPRDGEASILFSKMMALGAPLPALEYARSWMLR